MNRVATAEGWNSALLDLMRAQRQQLDAQNQVSTQKIATDLKGFGRDSETIAAFRSAAVRLGGYVETGEAVAGRLSTQDVALNRIADTARDARQLIADALASGRGESLMLALQQQFQGAVDGLNAKHQGRYLFGGARSDQAPVDASTLTDLTAAVQVDDLFLNDQLKAASMLDDASTVETGMLASDLGVDLFNAFKGIQTFEEGAGGPFTGALTDAQRTFLEAQLTVFDDAHGGLTDYAAQNGSLQLRVDSHLESQKAQADALEGLISERSDVDLAEAISRLQQAQLAVQASAQVLGTLKGMSLLDILR